LLVPDTPVYLWQSHCTGKEKQTERITLNTIPVEEEAQSVPEEKELLQSLLKFP
jgi:hypothetical protein